MQTVYLIDIYTRLAIILICLLNYINFIQKQENKYFNIKMSRIINIIISLFSNIAEKIENIFYFTINTNN